MHRTTRIGTTIGALALVLAMTGCAPDEEPTAETEDTTTAEKTSAAEASAAPEDGAEETGQAPADGAEETSDAPPDAAKETREGEGSGAPVSGGATPPGTELAIGEAATVQFAYAGETGLITITVTRIEKGEPADLEPLELGEQVAGLTPYYIQLEVDGADESANALSNADVSEAIEGLLADGSSAQSLNIVNDVEPCDDADLGDDFADGVSVRTCAPYLAGEGAEVRSVQFAPFEGPYSSLEGEPVVWRP